MFSYDRTDCSTNGPGFISPMPTIEEGPLTPSPAPVVAVRRAVVVGDRDRGRQSMMEMQLLKLHDEVQQLRGTVQEKLYVDDPSAIQAERRRLLEENENLLATLQDSERRANDLEIQIESLREDYTHDCSVLQEQVSELDRLCQEEQQEKEVLSRNYENEVKAKQNICDYLQTIPSVEEVNKLMEKLRLKEDESSRMSMRLSTASLQYEKVASDFQSAKSRITNLERQNEELNSQLSRANDKIALQDRVRAEAQSSNGSGSGDVENLLLERANLADENDRIKRYLAAVEKKHKTECERLERQLEVTSTELREKTHELAESVQSLAEETSTSRFLREDLTNSKALATSLQRKLEAYRTELDEVTSGRDHDKELGRGYSIMSAELKRCLEDLRALSELTKQLMNGEEPNVSKLLGIKDFDRGSDKPQMTHHLPVTQRIAILKEQISEIKCIRTNIASLRNDLAEKYSERIGDNIETSCVSQ